jgi:pyruvate/2-oxoglutarate dehydrogenase complex dihydrolipoamide acyltransferase (E2) component
MQKKASELPHCQRIAAEKGMDISSVVGSGPNGRIVEKDILKFLVEHDLSVKRSMTENRWVVLQILKLDRRTRQMAVSNDKELFPPSRNLPLKWMCNGMRSKKNEQTGAKKKSPDGRGGAGGCTRTAKLWAAECCPPG